MKKGSVIPPVHREYIQRRYRHYIEKYSSNKIKKDLVAGLQNNIPEVLRKLVKEQSATQVDLEQFNGNPREYIGEAEGFI